MAVLSIGAGDAAAQTNIYDFVATGNFCEVRTTQSSSRPSPPNWTLLYNATLKCQQPLATALVRASLHHVTNGEVDNGGWDSCSFAANPKCGVETLSSGDQAFGLMPGTYRQQTQITMLLNESGPGDGTNIPDPWVAWDPRAVCLPASTTELSCVINDYVVLPG